MTARKNTCAFESGHLTLVSGAGEGEVVSKKVARATAVAPKGQNRWIWMRLAAM